ncbi:MAG: glycoside hydrolase family protein [Steroidobacteraceae bacterium]
MFDSTRRSLLSGLMAAAGAGLASRAAPARGAPRRQGNRALPDLAPFQTPYKYGKRVLEKSGVSGSFDERSVDCPFVFSANGRFYMTYVGYDGTGYQTGLAQSDDLVHWQRSGLIMARDPADPITRYNIALMCILRDDALDSDAPLMKLDGRYLGAWHAYPSPGYEQGPAVIGLAWSDDLRHWQRAAPILRPEDGAPWERGGLYKPYLVKRGGTYFLFYNAKTVEKRWHEQIGLATSPDLKTWTRYPGNPLVRNGAPDGPDTRFASDPCVLRHGPWWALYYYGLAADGHARDLLALGRDPFHFTKVPEIIVNVGPPGSIDEDYAHKPSLIFSRGALHHFYCCVSGKWPRDTRAITVARSTPWLTAG